MTSVIQDIQETNTIFYRPLQELFNVINDNVPDINSTRASKTDARGKQWIFPTLPAAIDQNYPRIAIISDDVTFEEYGAGDFIETIKDGSGNVIREIFGNLATIPITITAFVRRNRPEQITNYDGSNETAQNEKVASWLIDRVQKTIFQNQDFLKAKDLRTRVLSISSSYNDSEYLIGKNLDIEIEIPNVFTEEVDGNSIIKKIDFTVDVDQVC